MDIPLSNHTLNSVGDNLTHDSLPSKDRTTTHKRKCFLIAHTLILQKGRYKLSPHLQKALNDATDTYAGAASPGREKEQSGWDEVAQIH